MKSAYSIGEFSKKTGIPIRTLHYYEEAGLLLPNRQASGHRSYTLDDLVKLQKILSLKSLGFRLAQIGELLRLPEYDQSLTDMLKLQKQTLESEREKIEDSLALIERMIDVVQAEQTLDHDLLFSLIRNMNQEGRQREWVASHLSEFTARSLFDLSAEAQRSIDAETVRFSRDVKRLAKGPFDSEEAQTVIGAYVKWAISHLDRQALMNFRSLGEEHYEHLDQLVEMPFNEQEMLWLEEALKHCLSHYELTEQGELREIDSDHSQ